MRVIKFRAWDDKYKVMLCTGFSIVGEVTLFSGVDVMLSDQSKKHNDDTPSLLRLNDLIIMQFTGLTDKNGKEIYEGDVFQVAANKKYTVKYLDRGESNYEFMGATFILWFNEKLFFPFDEYAMKTGQVIGNIYEHPELLEQTT